MFLKVEAHCCSKINLAEWASGKDTDAVVGSD